MQQEKDTGNQGMQGKGLRHEESLGNKLLRSIDPEWLLEHKDLLDLIASNPSDQPPHEQVWVTLSHAIFLK